MLLAPVLLLPLSVAVYAGNAVVKRASGRCGHVNDERASCSSRSQRTAGKADRLRARDRRNRAATQQEAGHGTRCQTNRLAGRVSVKLFRSENSIRSDCLIRKFKVVEKSTTIVEGLKEMLNGREEQSPIPATR